MNKKTDIKTIVVAGDATIDWNIARIKRKDGVAQAWTADEITTVCCQRGGAALLADLITAVASNSGRINRTTFEVYQEGLPNGRISPTDDRFHHSFAMWEPFKLDDRKPESGSVWRVQEFLGLSAPHAKVRSKTRPENTAGNPIPEIIVLDDANLGFRDRPEAWSRLLSSGRGKPWILVKMAKPVVQGKLWEHLQQHHAERTIVIMTAGDLRNSQVQISRQLSWERTAQDLVWELTNNPHVNTLSRCAFVIVSFTTAGAVLHSRKPDSTPEATLFFDPVAMEGEWGRHYRGFMIGYNSCLTAGIARQLMLEPDRPDIARGIQSGILAMRTLHIEGYCQATGEPGQANLAFPVSRIAEVIAQDGKCLATARISSPAHDSPVTVEGRPGRMSFWTILEDKNPDSLESLAERIVLEGLERTLNDVPMGQFGNLKTVDRREIESLHSISSLIRDYCQRYQKSPLSIAVFGPPGSGKSFSVEEVAKSVMPDEIKRLTFNLSQLEGLENLTDAFHQVRDVALTGKVPLVFWDEFDTTLHNQPLGWLRYFLAPMQDGEFQEGQISHPIGRSIFVFAGGTSHSMDAFGANTGEYERRAMKLPDFVSRLKGFLNIMGPNRQTGMGTPGLKADPYYIIRRAIILRSNFERFAPRLLLEKGGKRTVNIDLGVLRAFLLAREYRHGARSLEAIIAMSQLAGKTVFERSSLPSETQLNLHVDGLDFYAIMHRIELDAEVVEKLAEAFHEIFCDSLRARHFRYGPVTDNKKRLHSSLRPYAELPENEKEQNHGNVRDISRKLLGAGYNIISARGHESPARFTDEEVERLATEEHERWMKQKLDAGWKYAVKTNKATLLHKDLVDWEQLPESEKEKDRVLVRGIPRILAKAGYAMVKPGR
ncbi:MAG: hypothetical protein A2Z29_02085 [Chloroflexi bacterium RBG_16_56_11]|nr:MAG: hypothetical protein A2Z29_02085 [Chloroflexi bacterium RBG_16_56_11]